MTDKNPPEKTTTKNTSNWRLDQHAIQQNTLLHRKHSYRLTLPDFSAAKEIAQSTDLEQQIQYDDERLYLQSNLPYLALLSLIFIVNGLILFFGEGIKQMMKNQQQENQAVQQIPGDWQNQISSWDPGQNGSAWQIQQKSQNISVYQPESPSSVDKPDLSAEKTRLFE